MALSDYDGAASVLAKALSLSLNDPGTPALPAIFGNLGSVAHRMGRRGEAENYWERAASEAERLGESPAPYLGSLLRNAYDSKNAEALETNLARALGSLEHPGTDSASRADILNLAGLAALDRGDPETARARLSEALDLDRAGENVEGMAEDLEALAKLENMAGDFGKEAGFLDRAFYLRTALKDKKGAARIRASLEAAAKAGANADLAEYRRLTEHPNLFDPYASLCPDR
jgi:Tfp pilus assembly protein PilF